MQDEIEEIMQKIYHEKLFETWVKNFAVNLNDIWNEPSVRELDPTKNSDDFTNDQAIVIGKGPSIKEHKHLEFLANSDYHGSIVCCDGALINTLKAGVNPAKFPKFFVVSIEGRQGLKKYYDDDEVKKYGNKINGIFSIVSDPEAIKVARKSGIKIHWMHALFDYEEGKKSFNQISALMVRAKNHSNGLPGLQTGGNVGTTAWFVSWQILKCSTVALIGIDHGWKENDSWEMITSHGFEVSPPDIDKKHPTFNKLFPKIYNPDFNCYCILDPIFQYYRKALKEFIVRSPSWLSTINTTEGGSIFGDRIKSMTLKEFIDRHKN